MISINSNYFENNIIFNDGKINVLEINNKKLFNKIIYILNRAINFDEESDEIFLYEDNIKISLGKNCLLITDIINIELNNPKIIKKLYENIEHNFNLIYDKYELHQMQKELLTTIKNVLNEFEFEFKQNDTLCVKDILKILNIKFDNNYYTKPFENVNFLLDAIDEFDVCKVIIFVNAKCYLSYNQMSEVYKIIQYKSINALFLEFYENEINKNYENKILIDEDFDEICM